MEALRANYSGALLRHMTQASMYERESLERLSRQDQAIEGRMLNLRARPIIDIAYILDSSIRPSPHQTAGRDSRQAHCVVFAAAAAVAAIHRLRFRA